MNNQKHWSAGVKNIKLLDILHVTDYSREVNNVFKNCKTLRGSDKERRQVGGCTRHILTVRIVIIYSKYCVQR